MQAEEAVVKKFQKAVEEKYGEEEEEDDKEGDEEFTRIRNTNVTSMEQDGGFLI